MCYNKTMKGYKTITGAFVWETTIKKSRFIANVVHVQTLKEVEQELDKICKTHYKATHHPYAYRLREENGGMKCSDDGEPSGTSGRPILNVLMVQELYDVLIVVTRYFGGIKLGANGLVRAYGQSAADAVCGCDMVLKIPCLTLKMEYEYMYHNKIMAWAAGEAAVHMGPQDFKQTVCSTCYIEQDMADRCRKELARLCADKIVLSEAGMVYLEKNIHCNGIEEKDD